MSVDLSYLFLPYLVATPASGVLNVMYSHGWMHKSQVSRVIKSPLFRVGESSHTFNHSFVLIASY